MSVKVKKIVMANGVFDMLHYGHLLHLEAARKMGDILWVSVTDDLHVRKGPGRPIYPQEQRLALIKALRCVDKAITVSGLIEALEIIRPHILVKGIDYKDGLHDVHEKYCKEHMIEIRYTDTPKLSATEFIYEAKRSQQF
jgi:rfaE bifunctional protein nucleotidyltransferase chain/domain